MPAYAGMTVQEVIPAQAGIHEPYAQLQTALAIAVEVTGDRHSYRDSLAVVTNLIY